MEKLLNFVLRALALAAIWLVSGGCGGNMPMTPAPPPPPPSISRITPPLVARSAGSIPSSFTLTVDGANFEPGSIVTWNGGFQSTRFIVAEQVEAFIDITDIAKVLNAPCGTTPTCLVTIDVVNSSGVHSNAVTLKIIVVPMI